MFSPRKILSLVVAFFVAGCFGRMALAQDAVTPMPTTAPIYILLDTRAKQCRWYGGNTDLSEVPSNWKSYQVSDGSGKNNTVELPGGTCDFSTTDIKTCCENIGYTYNNATSFVKKEDSKTTSNSSSTTGMVLGVGLVLGVGATLFFLKIKKKSYEPAP